MLHLTPNQLKIRLKEVLDRKRISFLELERQTGIKANRMYKWYKQNTSPKKEDSDILEKWLNNLENVPQETPAGPQPVQVALVKEPLEQAILNFSERDKINAEKDKINAQNLERLIHLLEDKYVRLQTGGPELPPPGTPGTETLKRKKKPAN